MIYKIWRSHEMNADCSTISVSKHGLQDERPHLLFLGLNNVLDVNFRASDPVMCRVCMSWQSCRSSCISEKRIKEVSSELHSGGRSDQRHLASVTFTTTTSSKLVEVKITVQILNSVSQVFNLCCRVKFSHQRSWTLKQFRNA